MKKGYKRPPFSKEWRDKIGKGNKGKKLSDETKLKISKKHTKDTKYEKS